MESSVLAVCSAHLEALAQVLRSGAHDIPYDEDASGELCAALGAATRALNTDFAGGGSEALPDSRCRPVERGSPVSKRSSASIRLSGVAGLSSSGKGASPPACDGKASSMDGCEGRRADEEADNEHHENYDNMNSWQNDNIILREISAKRAHGNIKELQETITQSHSMSLPASYRALRWIVSNYKFELVMGLCILLNTISMIVEEDYYGMQVGNDLGVYKEYGSQPRPGAKTAFLIVEIAFATGFTLEIMIACAYDLYTYRLGLVSDHRDPFWTSPWDFLDIAIVIISDVALFSQAGGLFGNTRLLRMFRLVRLLRLVKLARKLQSFDPLHLMTTAIQGSVSALAFSTMLFVLILTFFAMSFTQFVRVVYLNPSSGLPREAREQLFRYFGTYLRAMLSMFELTLANWPTICRFLTEEVHELFAVLVVAYKLSVGFAVVGVINGVFLNETFAVAKHDEFIMVRSRARAASSNQERITRIFQFADQDSNGELTKAELQDMLQVDAIRTWLDAFELGCTDADMLFELIAQGKDRVHVDEFIAGVGRLRGPARNIDVVRVLDILQRHQEQDLRRLGAMPAPGAPAEPNGASAAK